MAHIFGCQDSLVAIPAITEVSLQSPCQVACPCPWPPVWTVDRWQRGSLRWGRGRRPGDVQGVEEEGQEAEIDLMESDDEAVGDRIMEVRKDWVEEDW